MLKQGGSEQVESITTLETREVYRNQWLRLREDKILRSNGKGGIYSVVDKDDRKTSVFHASIAPSVIFAVSNR